LNRQGVPVARCTVERLMRAHGWRGVRRDRRGRATPPAGAAPARGLGGPRPFPPPPHPPVVSPLPPPAPPPPRASPPRRLPPPCPTALVRALCPFRPHPRGGVRLGAVGTRRPPGHRRGLLGAPPPRRHHGRPCPARPPPPPPAAGPRRHRRSRAPLRRRRP